MRLTPVIMCGGAGSRLWPTSTPARPKQFAPLIGERSTFRETLHRAERLASGGRSLVVAGVRHQKLVAAALRAEGVEADVLLEPEARDSGPAMAAAAAFLARSDPDTVMVVLSSDHHIEDLDGFDRSVRLAAHGARDGAIVTLGITPTHASTAFGYILADAARGDLRPVLSFVEKPDATRARDYVAQGYLWNSGMFVVTARTLAAELALHAPDVLRQARRAVNESRPFLGSIRLSEAFGSAPKISIDYAVMEKTERAAVVTADFDWVDIGAWDAVFEASAKDTAGNAAPAGVIILDSSRVLVRTSGGIQVAVVGVQNLAVVADGNSILVCAFEKSQTVKSVAAHLAVLPSALFQDLAVAVRWYDGWIRANALPLWFALGADHDQGGYHEALSVEGHPVDLTRRLRVQARQIYAYASAGLLGWQGPWRHAAQHGLDHISRCYRRADGLYRSSVDSFGRPVSETALLYDQAFVLLALAALHEADPSTVGLRDQAEALWKALQSRRAPRGGYLEDSARPYQSNAHMHLFEAVLAWAALYPEQWGAVADELGDMALRSFYDARLNVVHEVFDDRWRPARGRSGRLIEPGHQFEWAWLLDRWIGLRGDRGASAIALRLFSAGGRGVDSTRGVVINEMLDDFEPVDSTARLWPQTERLRASLVFGDQNGALAAINAIASYLATPASGAWRDRLLVDGTFVDEPAPASSLYHLVGAWRAIQQADQASKNSNPRDTAMSAPAPLTVAGTDFS